MKVLVVSRHPFDMRLGDAVRFVNIAQHLRSWHSFDLLCFIRPEQVLSSEARAIFDRVTMIPYPMDAKGSFVRRTVRAPSLRSIAPTSLEMNTTLNELLASGTYDILFSNGASMLQNLAPGRTPVPIVCDSIDSSTLTIEREWANATWRDRARLLRRLWHNRQLNQLIQQRVSANTFASELDASLFRQAVPSVRTEGIPNGVDPDYFCPGEMPKEPKSAVFEGNMMFGPNIDAAIYLCKEIVPRILPRHPDLRVYLVGRDPASEVKELASDNVVVTGTVADVRSYLWQASVFVCPMRLGAGIKNKILQAWATGLPVVATSAAMGGLGSIDGENVILRDDPASFAEAVSWLLEEPRRGDAIASAGRRRAVEHFSWAAQADRFHRLFLEVSSGRFSQATN